MKEKETKLPPSMENKHKPFIRISWEEARELLKSSLHYKYGAKGEIVFMKDYGYDGVGQYYDAPTFVDVYLKEN